MALTQKRITGKMLTLTVGTTRTIWQDFDLTLQYNEEDADAADSTEDEVVFTTRLLQGSVSGLLGVVNNGGTLPAEGDTLASINAAVGADTVLPDLSGYTNIRVKDANYNFKQGPGTFKLSFRNGVLEDGVVVVGP